jgi:AcrR family transcriptional regulator
MEGGGKPPKRPYRMRARAEAAAAVTRRILDATEELFMESFLDVMTLDQVATRAGVSVPTVLKRYPGKDQLIDAFAHDLLGQVDTLRRATPAGDVAQAVKIVLEDYERWGDLTIRALDQEERVPALRPHVEAGRVLHQDWVKQAFGPQLARRRGSARARLQAQLLAVTDVYTWKLLRRDAGLDVRQTERALTELLGGVLGGDS